MTCSWYSAATYLRPLAHWEDHKFTLFISIVEIVALKLEARCQTQKSTGKNNAHCILDLPITSRLHFLEWFFCAHSITWKRNLNQYNWYAIHHWSFGHKVKQCIYASVNEFLRLTFWKCPTWCVEWTRWAAFPRNVCTPVANTAASISPCLHMDPERTFSPVLFVTAKDSPVSADCKRNTQMHGCKKMLNSKPITLSQGSSGWIS